MHIELSFYEALGVAAMLVAALWGVMKMVVKQFNNGLTEKFVSMEAVMKLRADAQDVKLAHIDLVATRIQSLETDGLRRHADYVEKFCTKDELRDVSAKSERTLEGIFSLLRSIDDKVSNKVDRAECEGCRSRDRQ